MIAILTAVIETFWFLPLVFRSGKKGAVPKRYILFAALLGATLGTVIAVVSGLGTKLVAWLGLDRETGLGLFLFCLINAGLAEEFAKFFCGWLMLKAAKPTRKLDYILILGASAAGFAALESFLYASSSAIAIIRCLFPLHLMWQMLMGEHYYEALQAKKAGNTGRFTKEALLAFGIPIGMHTINDYIVFEVTHLLMNKNEGEFTVFDTVVAFLALGWLLGTIAFCVWEEVRVIKYVRQSRLADLPAEDNFTSPDRNYSRRQ